MWNMLWPILLVVGANTFYNISTKSMPGKINAFASLTVTYFTCFVLSIFMFYITSSQKNLIAELSHINWTSFVLGISVVALEFGYISLYRAGWKVSAGSLVANISLACVLLIVGLLAYKESISPRQLVGIGVCAVGLLLINK